MLGKAIQGGLQAAARIEQAANPVIAAAGIAGLAAAAGQEEVKQRRDRTASEAFLEEGLVGVISDKIISKGRSRIQNQEQVARRDQRGRFQPIARPLGQEQLPPPLVGQSAISRPGQQERVRPQVERVIEEERKTPEQSPTRAEEEQPLLQPEQPLDAPAEIRIAQDTQPPPQQPQIIREQDVEQIVQQHGDAQQVRDPSYLKMAGAFLVGQVFTIDNVGKILDAFHKWWSLSKEVETLNDPVYETLKVEEIVQRPVPEGCKRIVYRDAQTEELKTLVICGAQGERVYPGK